MSGGEGETRGQRQGEIPDARARGLASAPPGQDLLPGRHEVWATVYEGRPVVVKRTRTGVRQRLRGRLKGELSFENAGRLRQLGFRTPEPLGWFQDREASYYVAAEEPGAVQIRRYFLARYRGTPLGGAPALAFDDLVRDLAAMARTLHDQGVWYRDFTDGNILVVPPLVEGEPAALSLVDLNRIRFLERPLPARHRARDLARLGIERREDNKLFVSMYLRDGLDAGSGTGLEPLVWALRERFRLWNDFKAAARPWRRYR